jgi:hypothetical protein
VALLAGENQKPTVFVCSGYQHEPKPELLRLIQIQKEGRQTALVPIFLEIYKEITGQEI